MPDIGPIGPVCSDPTPNPLPRSRPSTARFVMEEDRPERRPERPADSNADAPTDRHQRIERIRQAIEAGTYPCDEKLEIAMRKMIDELSD